MASTYFCRDVFSEEEFTVEAYCADNAAEQAAEYWDKRGSVVEERDIEVTSEQSGEKRMFNTRVEFTLSYSAWHKEGAL